MQANKRANEWYTISQQPQQQQQNEMKLGPLCRFGNKENATLNAKPSDFKTATTKSVKITYIHSGTHTHTHIVQCTWNGQRKLTTTTDAGVVERVNA